MILELFILCMICIISIILYSVLDCYKNICKLLLDRCLDKQPPRIENFTPPTKAAITEFDKKYVNNPYDTVWKDYLKASKIHKSDIDSRFSKLYGFDIIEKRM